MPPSSDKSEDGKNVIGYTGWLQDEPTGGSMETQPGAH
jgi:hypothetical protein